jgi:hypothetical protein
MIETKKTYEQYCTFLERNIIIEETLTRDGKVVKKCLEIDCADKDKICRNKL